VIKTLPAPTETPDMAPGRRHSLFSQRLDSAVLASYFLGGVAPVGAFAWVVQRYVLPGVQADRFAVASWVGACISLALLSLGVFLALRVITKRALRRMTRDNERLSVLLTASREFATESHFESILARTSSHVSALAPSAGVALLFSRDADKPLELRQSGGAGGEGWWSGRIDAVRELAAEALTTGGNAVGTADDGRALVTLPFSANGLGQGALVLAGAGEALAPDAIDAASTVVGMAGAALRRGDLEDAQRNFFAHVTDMLVSALDSHVVEREGHAMGVARIANRLGHEIGLAADRIERLHFAAMLHDIGLLKFEQSRHLDPKALRLHPAVGARMLARIRLWEPIAPIILHHHEWWDGSGYPEGKAGEAIPLESRIVALADAVDAMRRPKAKRAAPLTLPEIAAEVAQGRDTQFDPMLVDAFLALYERGELA
jgi:HD-GYP domain-containing protein (c-di-GMP phosphodiesterase class II)